MGKDANLGDLGDVNIRIHPHNLMQQYDGASVQPHSMKYQCISIELRALGIAGIAPKVQGLGF